MSARSRSVEVGKFLAFVLRHHPEHVGLVLDPNGWVDVVALLEGCRARNIPLLREELEEAVRTSSKNRYELSEDGARIRARQGHSKPVDLGLPPREPPEHLFHGTVPKALEAIRRDAIARMSRQHVHLSADRETAVTVGARRGRALILVVRAREMWSAGKPFYLSTNGVWLTDHVPPEFIDFD